jgi:hypothetical protein
METNLYKIHSVGRRTDKTALKEVRLPATNSRTFQGKITLWLKIHVSLNSVRNIASNVQ